MARQELRQTARDYEATKRDEARTYSATVSDGFVAESAGLEQYGDGTYGQSTYGY